MLPPVITSDIVEWISNNIKSQTEIIDAITCTGGSINYTFRIITTSGDFFLKYNSAIQYPGMFETECIGLSILRDTGTVYVPQVYKVGAIDRYSYLLMKFEKGTIKQKFFWENFTSKLVQLHKITNEYYGLDHDNYIGSLLQHNRKNQSFIEFLITNRLNPFVRSAYDKGLLTLSDTKQFDLLYSKLPNLIPNEVPSLIHGDLWSGNLIIGSTGEACLIDPAVYFGCRETDIAMARLFGGFPQVFFDSYNEMFSMIKGWQERIDLHQLYPLLVHVNLFGISYASQVRSIISRY